MADRPDPLAPPDGYDHDAPRGSHGDAQSYERPDACWMMVSRSGNAVYCTEPMWVVLWFADLAEHVYPIGYCVSHALLVVHMRVTHCTACGMVNKIVKAETAGGRVLDPDAIPQAHQAAQDALDSLEAKWRRDG